MNVCIVYWYYPPTIGGVEIYLENLAKSISKKGINVQLVTGPVKGAKKIQKFGKLTVNRIHPMNIFGEENHHQNKGHDLLRYLENLIQEKDISLVSTQNFHLDVFPSHTLAVNTACLNSNIPLINTMHNYCETELDKAMLKNLMWKKIIGITKNMTEHAYKIGITLDKLNMVYSGISVKKFKPGKQESWLRNKYPIKEKDTVIVCPTRLIKNSTGEPMFERKGLTALLKAISIISQFKKNTKLLIVAAQPHPSRMKEQKEAIKTLKKLATLYKINKQLLIIEGVKPKFMPAVYNGSDVMVLAAKDEPFGLAYIEAMACELPVIGSSNGGVPEIIQNETNGYLTSDEPAELAKRIIWTIKNKRRMNHYGKKGREIVLEKFTLRRMAKETIKVYEDAIK